MVSKHFRSGFKIFNRAQDQGGEKPFNRRNTSGISRIKRFFPTPRLGSRGGFETTSIERRAVMTQQSIQASVAPCGLSCEKCFAHVDGEIRKHSRRLRELLGNFHNYALRFERLLDQPQIWSGKILPVNFGPAEISLNLVIPAATCPLSRM
jgi:hypothetical protein